VRGAVVAEPGYRTGLVVIAEVQGIPASFGQAQLPVRHRGLQVGQVQRAPVELVRPHPQLDVLELEHHV